VSDILAEGTWSYNSSGSSATYTNFNSGEPNGGTGENCVYLSTSSGGWNDVGCTWLARTMCEKVVQIHPKGNDLQVNSISS